MPDLDDILQSLAPMGAYVSQCRSATRAGTRALAPAMQALLGAAIRRMTPVAAIVVQAIANKLFVRRISTDDPQRDAALREWLSASGWDTVERDLWRAAIRDGVAFLWCGWDRQPVIRLIEAYNGETGAAAVEGATVSVYRDAAGRRCADLYYDDRIELYVYDDDLRGWTRRALAGQPWPAPWRDRTGAPLGRALIPVGNGLSEIESVLQLNEDINAAIIDLIAISRAQGWPQRYIRGDRSGGLLRNLHGQPVLDPYGQPIRRELRLDPGSIISLENPDAAIEQLDAATPDRTVITTLIELVSLISGVPSHYFSFSGQWPSGAAMLNAETRLNSRVEELQARYAPALVEMAVLLLRLDATFGPSVQPAPALPGPANVVVDWYPPQIETEDLRRDRSMHVAALYNAGLMSIETALAELHPDWTQEQRDAEAQRLRRAPAAIVEL